MPFFKIHFSGYVDCIAFTDTRYLFQVLFHYSNKMLLLIDCNFKQNTVYISRKDES